MHHSCTDREHHGGKKREFFFDAVGGSVVLVCANLHCEASFGNLPLAITIRYFISAPKWGGLEAMNECDQKTLNSHRHAWAAQS